METTSGLGELILELGFEKLAARASRRFPYQPEQPNLLPDVEEFDTSAMKAAVVDEYTDSPPTSRRQMWDQSQKLLKVYSGQPEILFWKCLLSTSDSADEWRG